jgi:hypothetical protein
MREVIVMAETRNVDLNRDLPNVTLLILNLYQSDDDTCENGCGQIIVVKTSGKWWKISIKASKV